MAPASMIVAKRDEMPDAGRWMLDNYEVTKSETCESSIQYLKAIQKGS